MHGVGGSTPEAILDQPITAQVAGDRNAGFFRPREGFSNPTGPGGVVIEAYRWGNLTGGTTIRTVSLVLLLPFMLSNIAIWMLPSRRGASSAAARSICRLLAGTLTVMYVLSVVGVTLNLLGWQCASYSRCLQGRDEINWLGPIPQSQRLALLALVPLAAIALLRWLGSRSWSLPEDASARPTSSGLASHRLDVPEFWNTRVFLQRLRALHLAVAVGTVDLSLMVVLAPHDQHPVGYLLLVAVIVLLAAAAALLCQPTLPGKPGIDRIIGRACAVVQAASYSLTPLLLVYAGLPRDRWIQGTSLPGYDRTIAWVSGGQSLLLVALGLVVVVHRRRLTAPAFLDGLGAPVVISFAIGIGVAFSSALVFGVADYLDRGRGPLPVDSAPAGSPDLAPPIAFRWAAMGFAVAVLVAAIAAFLHSRLTLRERRRVAADIIRRDFPNAPPLPQPRVRAVRDALARAMLTDRAGALPASYGILAVLALGAAGFALAGTAPSQLTSMLGARVTTPLVFLTTLGAYLAGVFAVMMTFAALFAYKSTGMRLVGVLWDLATFWPRSAHPLAPPCYSERAVPELTKRIRYLTEGDGRVVLSGHSHGSVLVAATVLQLPPSCLKRVAVLTYACPLRRLYSRVFPAYMAEGTLREIGGRVDWRWLNLWRDTDWVGGWIFSPDRSPPEPVPPSPPPGAGDPAKRVDRRLRDPLGLLVDAADTVPPPILGHRFDPDENFEAAVRDLAASLRATTDSGPAGA